MPEILISLGHLIKLTSMAFVLWLTKLANKWGLSPEQLLNKCIRTSLIWEHQNITSNKVSQRIHLNPTAGKELKVLCKANTSLLVP